ncbi:Zn-ribbon domain-containing OB-fold protein [Acidovorax delafieldii]|uniref:Zn-ribbon domain-containing OB-fold protein n=1 Tax=Acidovorax delafieldii TaxID=47920 RepID=UPI003ECC714B
MLKKRSTRHIVQAPEGLALLATRSRSDAPWQFPPAEFILNEATHEEMLLAPKGILYTYSIVHLSRDTKPYALAMVDFEPGVRAFGPMLYEPGDEPPIGAVMEVVPHTLEDGFEDYAFRRPVELRS